MRASSTQPSRRLPLAALLLLLPLLALTGCVVRTPTGEVDQEATREMNRGISSALETFIRAGAGLASKRMELEAEKERRKACQLCQGSKAVPCDLCRGRGWLGCPRCHGRGGSVWGPCRQCRATGRVSCPKCRGKGVIPCPGCTR